MARKPAAATTADELPPGMDYAQHDATYRGFLTFLKAGIISLAFIVLALYAFIEGHNALVGVVLLILALLAPLAQTLLGRRSA